MEDKVSPQLKTISMGLIRQRHNDILQRLVKAVPNTLGNKFVEQEIPGDPERNKPDLVIISPDNQTATIVDITVPFEGEEDSLTKARESKEDKYSFLTSWLLAEKSYQEVTVDAFVVGSLGSWDPANEAVLKRLQIHPIYCIVGNFCIVQNFAKMRKFQLRKFFPQKF